MAALADTISSRTTRFIESAVAAGSADLPGRLSSKRVAIALTREDASYEGQLITFTLLNLLVRLDDYCPRLEVRLPAVRRHPLLRLLPEGNFDDAVIDYLAPFPAANRLYLHAGDGPHETEVTLRVSPSPAVGALTVWANGWLAYLDRAPLAPLVAGPPNPVGPCLAAGLAAAEVFKRLIGDVPLRPGLKIRPAGSLVVSAYDYGLAEGPNPDIPEAVDVDGVVVVGLGGIGAAWAAAAASLEALDGGLVLVDRDRIDITSHNRHLVSRPGDFGPKVELAARALGFHRDVRPMDLWFEEFVQQHGDRHELVVVGVDKDVVRRQIQTTHPRVILNGGTSDDASLRATRHDFVHGACLSCISRDDLVDYPVERQLARQLGVSLETVLDYTVSGTPVPAEVLRAGGLLSEEHIEMLAGRVLPEIQVRVCSELQLGAGPEQPAVSISFLSAIPGFLLLGEVIKERAWPDDRPALNPRVNNAFLSTIGRPHPALLRGWLAKRDDCDCARSAFQRSFERKWRQT